MQVCPDPVAWEDPVTAGVRTAGGARTIGDL